VDDQIGRMVPENVKASEAVIEGKSQKGNTSVRQEFIEVANTPDDFIADNGVFVVENEGDLESVGIGNSASHQDQKNGGKRFSRKYFLQNH
jgi:hypothetical protein